MFKYIFLLYFGLLSSFQVFSQSYLPKSVGEIVSHTYYTLSYSEENEQAYWVYYELTPELVNGTIKRTDDFRLDPKVSTGSAELKDYKGSGYHRGHLCPAGSMDLNSTSMSESFYLSNMSPQAPSLNTGRWRTLESQVRKWANEYKKIIVISGPVFKDNIGKIGVNNVTVPGYYYKVIYCPGNSQMIAFVMPNRKLLQPITSYIKTVDEIEKLTDIDFFYDMDNCLQEQLESNLNISEWDFNNSNKIPVSSVESSQQSSTTVQCKGIAKSTGKRCKNMTKNANGYCCYHQNQAVE
jgi:endonuclease G